jgi:uncharacterized delta-60 repeat protein
MMASLAIGALTLGLPAQAQLNIGLAGKRFAMAAYKWDGSLDASFGANGKVVTVFPGSTSSGKPGVVLDAQQRIIVAGTIDNKVAISRYLMNGAPDPTFNGTGTLLTNLGYSWANFHAITIDAFDRILLSAIAPQQIIQGQTWHTIILARLQTNGAFDPTFGSQGATPGIVPTVFTADAPGAVAVSGNYLYVTSSITNDVAHTNQMFTCFRYYLDGTPAEFPTGLIAELGGDTIPGTSIETPHGLAADGQGKIVVAGTASSALNNNPGEWVVYRFGKDGYADPFFTPTGHLTGSFDGSLRASGANAMALDASGNIIIVGSQSTGTITNFGVARITPFGWVDTTFSGDGMLTIGLGLNSEARAVTISGGKVLAAGWAANFGPTFFALARYNSNGTLDITFNGTGKVTTQISCQGGSMANAIATQSVAVLPRAGQSGFFYTRILAVGTSDFDACP